MQPMHARTAKVQATNPCSPYAPCVLGPPALLQPAAVPEPPTLHADTPCCQRTEKWGAWWGWSTLGRALGCHSLCPTRLGLRQQGHGLRIILVLPDRGLRMGIIALVESDMLRQRSEEPVCTGKAPLTCDGSEILFDERRLLRVKPACTRLRLSASRQKLTARSFCHGQLGSGPSASCILMHAGLLSPRQAPALILYSYWNTLMGVGSFNRSSVGVAFRKDLMTPSGAAHTLMSGSPIPSGIYEYVVHQDIAGQRNTAKKNLFMIRAGVSATHHQPSCC